MTEFEAELRARRFVQEATITAVPIDIATYLRGFSGKILLDELEPNEAGYTMVTAKGPLITLSAADRAARRRFTACHEVGHLVLRLPSEHGTCDQWSYARRPPNEVCCDVFAAELLLPHRLFTAAAAGLALDFATVDRLRGDFFASREATASRLVATSKFACAYILSEQGRVRYLVRSTPMRNTNAWIAPGTVLPSESAARILRTTGGGSGKATHSGDVWFEGWRDVEIREESIFIPAYDQTLTILSCVDDDELNSSIAPAGAHSDEDNELLKPLDGQLPWPSGRNRKH